MSYYAKNPHEQPEPPRCLSCDEFMEKVGLGISFRWECRNPACEECPSKYQVVECSTCGEEYHYGEYCRNCVDVASHDLDISTSTHQELVELRKRQARRTQRALDSAPPYTDEELDIITDPRRNGALQDPPSQ